MKIEAPIHKYCKLPPLADELWIVVKSKGGKEAHFVKSQVYDKKQEQTLKNINSFIKAL